MGKNSAYRYNFLSLPKTRGPKTRLRAWAPWPGSGDCGPELPLLAERGAQQSRRCAAAQRTSVKVWALDGGDELVLELRGVAESRC